MNQNTCMKIGTIPFLLYDIRIQFYNILIIIMIHAYILKIYTNNKKITCFLVKALRFLTIKYHKFYKQP